MQPYAWPHKASKDSPRPSYRQRNSGGPLGGSQRSLLLNRGAEQEKGLLLGFKCQKKTDQEPCDTDGVLLFPHSRLFTSGQLNDYFSGRVEEPLDQSPRMILDPYKGIHPWDRACGGVLHSKKDQVHYLKYNASEDLEFSSFLKFLVSGNSPQYTFPS